MHVIAVQKSPVQVIHGSRNQAQLNSRPLVCKSIPATELITHHLLPCCSSKFVHPSVTNALHRAARSIFKESATTVSLPCSCALRAQQMCRALAIATLQTTAPAGTHPPCLYCATLTATAAAMCNTGGTPHTGAGEVGGGVGEGQGYTVMGDCPRGRAPAGTAFFLNRKMRPPAPRLTRVSPSRYVVHQSVRVWNWAGTGSTTSGRELALNPRMWPSGRTPNDSNHACAQRPPPLSRQPPRAVTFQEPRKPKLWRGRALCSVKQTHGTGVGLHGWPEAQGSWVSRVRSGPSARRLQ